MHVVVRLRTGVRLIRFSGRLPYVDRVSFFVLLRIDELMRVEPVGNGVLGLFQGIHTHCRARSNSAGPTMVGGYWMSFAR